jgi:4-aminobutyrate aminotransferase-like enzyme
MASGIFSREPVEVPKVETKYRLIKTKLPCPGTEEILADIEKYESRSMQGQYPIVWEKAKGECVFDLAGNRWIDFTSTIFVTNTGHGNEAITAAVKEVLDKPLFHTYAYANRHRRDYLKYLIENTPENFEKGFLLSAGTESTEAAVKLIRLNAQKNSKKPVIICIEGNWHGRTMGAQFLSSNKSQKAWIGHEEPHIIHIPFPYKENVSEEEGAQFLQTTLEKKLAEKNLDIKTDIAGFMLETFQGWGACYYPKSYVQEIEKVCKANNILLCFDEMQAGFGRTGKMFGYQNYDVTADLVCLGKGMGGGFTISGVLGSAEVMDLPDVGDMSSTHSANPIGCEAGLAVMKEIVEKDLVGRSAQFGEVFHQRLTEIKEKYSNRVQTINGTGLLAAIIFHDNGNPNGPFASKVAERCLHKGLLVVHTGRESIKLAPPLTIEKDAMLEGLDVLEESIKEILESEC